MRLQIIGTQLFGKIFFGLLALLLANATVALAQAPTALPPAAPTGAPAAAAPLTPFPATPPARTRVTKGSGALPNEHGQVWREYDIAPYTSRVTTTNKPEQAIIDWILRETGTEVWFNEPVGILSASKTTLRVYHTPKMQELVHTLVDRFVSSQAETEAFTVKLVTLDSPNWRSRMFRALKPVPVQTPGIEAWILSKEDGVVLQAELKKRFDYREHNAPNAVVHNGQPHQVSRTRPRQYIRSVKIRDDLVNGHELDMGQIEEGFSMQLNSLLSVDRKMIDAVVKLETDQIEKFVSVWIEVPTAAQLRQRVQVQIPQVASSRLHERFRWPSDHLLLISCGVVAPPAPSTPTTLGIPNPLSSAPARVDALLLIEFKGKASVALPEPGGASPTANLRFNGRY